MPGQPTHVRFTPTVEGEYILECAELCGLTHFAMAAPVRIVSEAEYASWQQAQLAAAGKTAAKGVSTEVEAADAQEMAQGSTTTNN